MVNRCGAVDAAHFVRYFVAIPVLLKRAAPAVTAARHRGEKKEGQRVAAWGAERSCLASCDGCSRAKTII